MNLEIFIQKVLESGKEKFDDLEVFLLAGKSLDIKIFGGQVDKYSISQSQGLSLRGVKDGKMGYSYTEKLDDSSIDLLINEALDNSKYIDVIDGDEIFSGSSEYRNLNNFNEDLSKASMEERIDFAKKLEEVTLSLDKRVTSVETCSYQEFEQERYIFNTKGVRLKDKRNGAFAYVTVVAKVNDDTKTGFAFRTFAKLSDVSPEEIAQEAVSEALSMLGAKSIMTGTYKIVIKNTSFADLLDAFSSVFSADNAQKGLSILKDKVGEKIGVDFLNIIEDPFLEKSYGSRAFDDEGTATSVKKIVDKGKLTSLLHTWRTAKKNATHSTGNASRPSYKSSLSISPSNFYVEKGDITFLDLIETTRNGIYITDLQGLHSGLNQVSGDFSLSAQGFEIKNGSISRPINQITLAGNFFDLLKNIGAISDDLSFSLPASGTFGSPSILIKELSIAGE